MKIKDKRENGNRDIYEGTQILKSIQQYLEINFIKHKHNVGRVPEKNVFLMVFCQTPPLKTVLIAVYMTYGLQTKCKTCFGGTRMILH